MTENQRNSAARDGNTDAGRASHVWTANDLEGAAYVAIDAAVAAERSAAHVFRLRASTDDLDVIAPAQEGADMAWRAARASERALIAALREAVR